MMICYIQLNENTIIRGIYNIQGILFEMMMLMLMMMLKLNVHTMILKMNVMMA